MELKIYWTEFARDELKIIFTYYKRKAGHLKDKPLMIVNLTGCNGPGTFVQFDQFYEKFKDSFHIISLEPLINKDLPGILVDTELEENQDFYKKYRDAYSS